MHLSDRFPDPFGQRYFGFPAGNAHEHLIVQTAAVNIPFTRLTINRLKRTAHLPRHNPVQLIHGNFLIGAYIVNPVFYPQCSTIGTCYVLYKNKVSGLSSVSKMDTCSPLSSLSKKILMTPPSPSFVCFGPYILE